MKLKKIKIILLSFFASLFFIQAIFQFEIIPTSKISFLFGVDASSAFSFLIYPFLYFSGKYFFIAFKILLNRNNLKEGEQFKMVLNILEIFKDLFRWFIAIYYSLSFAGVLILLEIIPNGTVPIYINLYICFFIAYFAVRVFFNGDFFDFVISSKKENQLKSNNFSEKYKKEYTKIFFLKFITLGLIFSAPFFFMLLVMIIMFIVSIVKGLMFLFQFF